VKHEIGRGGGKNDRKKSVNGMLEGMLELGKEIEDHAKGYQLPKWRGKGLIVGYAPP